MNKISTLKFLSFCPKLTELYIRKNDLQSLDELKCLQQLPNLRILWLTENPLCTDNYRQLVLDLLPGIVKLDNVGKCQFVAFLILSYTSFYISFCQSDQFNDDKDIEANLVICFE